MNISVHPYKAVTTTAVIAIGLCAVSLVGATVKEPPYFRLWNVDAEQSIPTFYTVALATLCALCFVVLRNVDKPRRSLWTVSAVALSILALDEGLAIHELTSSWINRAVDAERFDYVTWVLPYSIVAVVLVGAMTPLLRQLSRTEFRDLTRASGLYLAGAIGVEVLTAALTNPDENVRGLYGVLTAFEELAEMLGLILVLRFVLDHLAESSEDVTFSFGTAIAKAEPL